MRILSLEGNAKVNTPLKDWSQLLVNVKFDAISFLCDLIYYLWYTDKEYDYIIIGEDFETNIDTKDFEEGLKIQLEKLSNGTYFPVTLGNMIKKLCKEKGKKCPEIVIMTTFDYWAFNGKPAMYVKPTVVKSYIKQNHMKCVDKNEYDFAGDLARALKLW